MPRNAKLTAALVFALATTLPCATHAQLFQSKAKADTVEQKEAGERSLKEWLFGNKQERKALKEDHREAKDDFRAARKERKAAEARERAAKARADAIRADRRAARAEKRARKAEQRAEKAQKKADGEHQNLIERLFGKKEN
ncbi:MAG: hypothetical protein GVY26_17765 [Bacteroidetes bacterium]|jgi:chromatin remodeling complex protein RSC6|nr:hypothetical protein [Bacteroidota bacterium]